VGPQKAACFLTWAWKEEVNNDNLGGLMNKMLSSDAFMQGWNSLSSSTFEKYMSYGATQRVADTLPLEAKILEPSSSQVQGLTPKDFLDKVFHFGKNIFHLIFASYLVLLSFICYYICIGPLPFNESVSGYSGL
jgi:type IV secretory pathway TrbL component